MARRKSVNMEDSAATEAAPSASSGLVDMRRETPQHDGGPVTARVHPVEVEAWMRDGWVIVDADD